MKKRSYVFFVLFSFFLISACGSGQISDATPTLEPTSTPEGVLITGKVYWSETNSAIENALVEIDNAELEATDPGYKIAEVLTDADGAYMFSGLQPGTFTFNVSLIPDKYEIKTDDLPPCTTSGMSFGSSQNGDMLLALSFVTKDGFPVYSVSGFILEITNMGQIDKDLDIFCG